ncbi:hypothetical protein H3V53_13830 [Paraburkholderia bengalensis]|uniref:Uncharacterized protein n=1 Tax=Paraburkholderia bengalensis TaxID=2747562 RepID=A0ABU8IRY5_9BURK
MGRPAYKPTDRDREQVKMLSGMGIDGANIAALLGISEPTMRKYFRRELEIGYVQANAQVAQSLFRQATDKNKPNVVAAIFWMKTRAGWVEAKPEEATKGKKDVQKEAAQKVARGKFAPTAPPKLIASGGRKV